MLQDETIRHVQPFTTRRGTVADVDLVGMIVQAGFESYREFARLFTPSLQVRARRFYERRGWLAQAETWSEEFALAMTEYQLPLD